MVGFAFIRLPSKDPLLNLPLIGPIVGDEDVSLKLLAAAERYCGMCGYDSAVVASADGHDETKPIVCCNDRSDLSQ